MTRHHLFSINHGEGNSADEDGDVLKILVFISTYRTGRRKIKRNAPYLNREQSRARSQLKRGKGTAKTAWLNE